jgi:AraC-like DNA-binding protein
VLHAPPEPIAPLNPATRTIAAKLGRFLSHTQIRGVYFAEDSVAPPVLAYVTHFPRLYVPLAGCHTLDVTQNAVRMTIHASRGCAVFVPGNAWDKPTWSMSVEVLTFLFGTKHIGISLAQHQGGAEAPVRALKTNIHGAYDGLTHSILGALTVFAGDRSDGPLAALLVEALLRSCLRLLQAPALHPSRKAVRTYESICLYLQGNFQSALTRESVASHFHLSPNHVSRLFRREGQIRFNDYVNLIRMNRAKFMLRNYNLPLKEIAAKCGYQDVAYFCRMFKKMNKETPTQYRGTLNGAHVEAG